MAMTARRSCWKLSELLLLTRGGRFGFIRLGRVESGC